MKEILAYDYLTETIKLKESIEVSFLTLGERLAKIRNEQLWKAGHESFEEFLHEAKISPSTASKLINIYSRFYLEWQFPSTKLVEAGGWSVIATLLPICESKEEAEEWMEKAHALGRQDLEKEIKEFRTGKPMAACLHDNYYTLMVCRTCGDKRKIYSETDSSQEI